MAEITHVDLNKLAERLELSFRRDVDGLREDLCDRIEQVRSDVEKQSDRVGRTETVLGAAKEDVRVLRHDFNNHVHAHPGPTDRRKKSDKGFIAGAVAAAMLLGGVASSALEFFLELLKRLKP